MFLQKEPIHRSSFAAPRTTVGVVAAAARPAVSSMTSPRPRVCRAAYPRPGPEDWTYQPRVHGGSELSCPTGAAPVHAAPRGPEPSTSLRLAVSRRDVTRAPRTRPPFAPTHPPPAAPCTGSDSPGAPPPLDTLPPGSRSSAPRPESHTSRGFRCETRPPARANAVRLAACVRDFPFASGPLPCSKGKPSQPTRDCRARDKEVHT